MKNKLFTGVFGTVLLLNLAFGYKAYSDVAEDVGEEDGLHRLRQFVTVMRLIQKHYVDESKVDYEQLVYSAMDGMVGSLDRFSSFIPPSDYDDMREETEGEFGGIGVVISVDSDVLTVVAPMPNSPGMKAGLQAKDQITKVDGETTLDKALPDAVRMIKGEPGTKVTLTIYRPPTKETLDVTVVRALIEIETIRNVSVLPGNIAYMCITQFNDKTADEMSRAMKGMQSNSRLRGVILDLRFNPGGLLTSAIDVASMFIEENELVVFTEGNERTKKQEYFSLSGDKFLHLPCIILINEGSASGAEIVAGCLQDYNRAILVGEQSFGKGSVQSIIELDDGSAVRLTTSKYYTPSRHVIHGNGIAPDALISIDDKQASQLHRQLTRIEGLDPDPDDPPDITDTQLQKAKDILLDLIKRSGADLPLTSPDSPSPKTIARTIQTVRQELLAAATMPDKTGGTETPDTDVPVEPDAAPQP